MKLLALALFSLAGAALAADLNGAGDLSMRPLMDAWMDALHESKPDLKRGPLWRFVEGGSPFGALMFEAADLAPLARKPVAAELAPYAHQFAGDMMKAPLLVRVAGTDDRPAYIAVNKRPDSPLPPQVKEFLEFALSPAGQRIVSANGTFSPLDSAGVAAERAKLQGFLAPLDPDLQPYKARSPVSGEINSVGSDGMKTLMDRWMRDFRRAQPGVRKGERWEHLGTLNGFHALVAGETDLAPMGRELWPAEAAVYQAEHERNTPLEIRVARGGFNTPQRTTAQAIFVNERNPLDRITVSQLAAIFAQPRTLTRWGQLGLEGEWAQRPIEIRMPPRVAPNAMSMQAMVLNGNAWADGAREGSIADTAAAIAKEPGAIGFGGVEEGGPGLKALAVATQDSGPFWEANALNAATGRYPLTRYMYIRLDGSRKLPVHVREFLRYILSREGQEPILYSGYFPLSAREAQEELAKLD